METSDIITVQDLWSAGVTETPLPGALVGSPALMIMCSSKIWRIYPCFACFHFLSSDKNSQLCYKREFIFSGRSHLQLHNWPPVPQHKIWRQVLERFDPLSGDNFFSRFFYEKFFLQIFLREIFSADFSMRTGGGQAVSHWSSWSRFEDFLWRDFSATTLTRLKLFRCTQISITA